MDNLRLSERTATARDTMDLDQLRAFIQVADCGSFSQAATRLHLTQPAISKRIRALELHLGASLFDRMGRRVLPTLAGQQLLASARDLLARLQDTEVLIRNQDGRVEGTLTLATSHHIGLHRLPETLRAFCRRYPQVRLDVRFEDSEVAHELVRSGSVEIGVVTLDPLRDASLAYLPLWTDTLCFVAAPEHWLASGPRRIANLVEHAAILPGMGTYTGRIVADLFARRGLTLQATMSTNYLETIRMLVSIGLGWSALPETMVDGTVQRVQLVDDPKLARDLGCIVHPGRTLSNAARAFVKSLTDSAGVTVGDGAA